MNMKQQIRKIANLKTLAMGFVLGICVMLLTGAGANDQGPYQCCQAGENDSTVFIVDTRDGHSWRMGRYEYVDMGTPLSPKLEKKGSHP